MEENLIEPLTKEQEDLTLAEIGYSREQLQLDIIHIREWLNSQQHLPPSKRKEKDSFLIWYLTGCKGSLEKVKQKLDAYYTSRSLVEVYFNRDPQYPPYVEARLKFPFAVIPKPNDQGIRLVITAYTKESSENFDFVETLKISATRTEFFLRMAGINSRFHHVIDCKHADSSVVFKIKPSLVKDALHLFMNVYPTRVMKFHFINTPPYIEVLVNNIVKPFISEKLKARLHVTACGAEDLLNYFSPKILPSDYCGERTNPTLWDYHERWSNYEDLHRDWIRYDLSEQVDESKRITTGDYTPNSHFGVHGSLKQLVVD